MRLIFVPISRNESARGSGVTSKNKQEVLQLTNNWRAVGIRAPLCHRLSSKIRVYEDPPVGEFCVILTSKTGAKKMASYATTRLSSKGQVVIPEEIRNNLGLSEGDQFVVIGEGDTVILKTINPPKIEEFNRLLVQASSAAKRAGIRRVDVKAAIAKVRRRTK